MGNFRLLTRTRQITEYSCGASALQAVLSYWGRDLEETEIMKIIGTSEDVGTCPHDIVRGVRALGLEAAARDELTLDEVRCFGHPMIALCQVWRSQRSSAPRPEDDWDNGHYIVVLGVDDEYVYFQDPYLRMGKAFVTRQTFERHWHQIIGGEAASNPKLLHLGIFIRGQRPASTSTAGRTALGQLDFARLGSLNLMVTEYPCVMLPFDFMDELRELWASSAVRPDAFVLVCKDADGNLSAMEGGRLENAEDAPQINALLAAVASRRVGVPESAGERRGSSLTVLPAIVLRGTHEYVPVAPRRVLRRKAPQANSGQHSRSVERVPRRADPGMRAFSKVSTTARGSSTHRCGGHSVARTATGSLQG